METLRVGRELYAWHDLSRIISLDRLRQVPYSLRILLENVARCTPHALPPFVAYLEGRGPRCEVPFRPNRLMLHDTTCLPALADFAGMRDAVAELGGNPERLNPSIPVVLTIDHSVVVESYATAQAVDQNLDIDFRRNAERYRFIKWAQQGLHDFKVVPPGTGIIHQVNMESLARVVWETVLADGTTLLHPDCMVATDSHTPMVNALGVLAWGIGGVEGQAVMLGEPVSIVVPQVVGLRVTGKLRPGVTGTDLALHLTKLLRSSGVVSKFVELCGPGVGGLDWGTRGTVANMAPEYGATVVYFPFDEVSLEYLRLTGRDAEHCERVATYMKAQHLWRNEDPVHYDEEIPLNLADVSPSVAGPDFPHQRLSLGEVADSFRPRIAERKADPLARFNAPGLGDELAHGAVAIAAKTSCTNTSNPRLVIAAALLARNASRRGLRAKPWVKTSFSPGSRAVVDYLEDAGLVPDLEALGFHAVGFGCMTCIGSSGPLDPRLDPLVDQGLLVTGVLSGNRNFEGRVHPKIAGGYLASPPLVIAYAIAGSVMVDFDTAPLARDLDGSAVFLRELWPADDEVEEIVRKHVRPEFFAGRNKTLWLGTEHWRQLDGKVGIRYAWEDSSTYLRRPAYTHGISLGKPGSIDIRGARPLLVLSDNVTTDHISPAGTIPPSSAAGKWLLDRGEKSEDLNQYSTRRSNHEVMLRGAFTTPNLRNLLLGEEHPFGKGAYARSADGGSILPVFDAAATYACPLVIFAGINYGAGSSRDWAAKAPALLGVRAIAARSFERIHRSNLIGMGIFPLVLPEGLDLQGLITTGREVLDVIGLDAIRVGRQEIFVSIQNGGSIAASLQIDSDQELAYLRHGGILPYVVRKALH